MSRTREMHPLKIVASVGAALLVWGLLLVYVSSPAWASTITVNSLADNTDGADGRCTLREAIISANTDTASGSAEGECAKGSGDDVIDIGRTGTVKLTGVLPALSTNIDIEGPGANEFTVRRDTGGNYRIFGVNEPSATVSISGMKISNGFPSSGLFAFGGGILNFGTLTITGSTITRNSTEQSGDGSTSGGGIANFGTLTITDSTISRNSALDGPGGGIISHTTLDGVTTTITNSTISGNTAAGAGGGVFNSDGLTIIKYSTITDNTAPSGEGSGVASFPVPSTRTEVLSSIISANTNTDVDLTDGGTTNSFASKGYNLIGNGDATAAFNQTGDQIGVDPKLAPLGFYGGRTKTIKLLRGSPAINAIPNTVNGCGTEITTDQRGVKRPRSTGCDIGAFEKGRLL